MLYKDDILNSMNSESRIFDGVEDLYAYFFPGRVHSLRIEYINDVDPDGAICRVLGKVYSCQDSTQDDEDV